MKFRDIETTWNKGGHPFVRTKNLTLPCGMPLQVVIQSIGSSNLADYTWTMCIPTEGLFLESSEDAFSKIAEAEHDADKKLEYIFSLGLSDMKSYINSFKEENNQFQVETDSYSGKSNDELLNSIRVLEKNFEIYKKKMLAMMYSYEMLIIQLKPLFKDDEILLESVVDRVEDFHGGRSMNW